MIRFGDTHRIRSRRRMRAGAPWRQACHGVCRFPFRWLGLFAAVIVHFRFFLHISFSHKREDLQLILFSTVLLIIMVAGTIWIMGSLATRMAVPMSMSAPYP